MVGYHSRAWALALAGAMCQCCSPAKSAQAEQATVRSVVAGTELAWMAAAETCVDVAATKSDQKLLVTCASILEPARNELMLADSIVNGWTDATTGSPLVVTLQHVTASVDAALVIMGVKPPTAVTEAETALDLLAKSYIPQAAK